MVCNFKKNPLARPMEWVAHCTIRNQYLFYPPASVLGQRAFCSCRCVCRLVLSCFCVWLLSHHLWLPSAIKQITCVDKTRRCDSALLRNLNKLQATKVTTNAAMKHQVTRFSIKTVCMNCKRFTPASRRVCGSYKYFTECICPSPPRAPDYTTAWAKGFICDH